MSNYALYTDENLVIHVIKLPEDMERNPISLLELHNITKSKILVKNYEEVHKRFNGFGLPQKLQPSTIYEIPDLKIVRYEYYHGTKKVSEFEYGALSHPNKNRFAIIGTDKEETQDNFQEIFQIFESYYRNKISGTQLREKIKKEFTIRRKK